MSDLYALCFVGISIFFMPQSYVRMVCAGEEWHSGVESWFCLQGFSTYVEVPGELKQKKNVCLSKQKGRETCQTTQMKE